MNFTTACRQDRTKKPQNASCIWPKISLKQSQSREIPNNHNSRTLIEKGPEKQQLMQLYALPDLLEMQNRLSIIWF